MNLAVMLVSDRSRASSNFLMNNPIETTMLHHSAVNPVCQLYRYRLYSDIDLHADMVEIFRPAASDVSFSLLVEI